MRGKERADLVDEDDAGHVCEFAEDRGADAAHAEGESEEESGDHADAVGDEFLRVDEDGREGRGDDEADDDREDTGPQQIGVGEDERERQHAEDRAPHDGFAADLVSDGAADEGAGSDGGEEGEEMKLRAADGYVELRDEVEGVVAGEAREVDILGEDERAEDANGYDDPGAGEMCVGLCFGGGRAFAGVRPGDCCTSGLRG